MAWMRESLAVYNKSKLRLSLSIRGRTILIHPPRPQKSHFKVHDVKTKNRARALQGLKIHFDGTNALNQAAIPEKESQFFSY